MSAADVGKILNIKIPVYIRDKKMKSGYTDMPAFIALLYYLREIYSHNSKLPNNTELNHTALL